MEERTHRDELSENTETAEKSERDKSAVRSRVPQEKTMVSNSVLAENTTRPARKSVDVRCYGSRDWDRVNRHM